MENVNIEALVTKLQEWLVTFGMQLVAAIIILLIGIQVAKFSRKLVEKALTNPKLI